MQKMPYVLRRWTDPKSIESLEVLVPKYVGHIFEVHPLDGPCWGGPTEGFCTLCDGGLSNCIVCGLAEGTLTTECPGTRQAMQYAERVFSKELDFVDGLWRRKLQDR